MANRARKASRVITSAPLLRRRMRALRDAALRAMRGDLEVLDRYFAVMLPVVFAAFYVLDKGPHRNLFYVFALLPMLFYIRRPVLAAVARSWPWRLGIGICALWMVSVVWSQSPSMESAFDAVRTAGALAIFLTACTALALRDRFPDDRIVQAVVVTAAVCAVVTFVLAAIPGSGYSAADRLKGFGWADHSGNGADIYGFAAVLAMVMAVESGSWRTAAAVWLAFAVCVVYVFLAESRAPALGLVAAAGALGFAKSPRIGLSLLAVFGLAGVGVHAVGLVDFTQWIARGPAYRLELWADALRQIPDHPLLGAGGADRGVFTADGLSFNSPHNGVIGMFYYLGILGGSLFVALCGYVVWQAGHHAVNSGSVLALATIAFGLTVLLFHTKTVIVMLNRDWLIFWLPVILIVALRARSGYRTAAIRAGVRAD